jgi:Mg2+ and Co2+ transporter CorA
LEFNEVLNENNGRFFTQRMKSNNSDDDNLDRFQIMTKFPLVPTLNGGFFLSFNIATSQFTLFLLFSEGFLKTLESVVHSHHCADHNLADPFIVLSSILQHGLDTLEGSRQALDRQIVKQESATGATLVTLTSFNFLGLENYPPLFEQLHLSQQGLLFLQREVQFQVELISWLLKQHYILTHERMERRPEIQRAIKYNSQRAVNSLSNSLSQAQNMRAQVDTLQHRVIIQLSIVESRLNQTNGRTQLVIAKEMRRDSVAMKAIAILTMIFLPGTFTATFFAMPFFKIDDSGPKLPIRVSSSLSIYFVITAPLTAVVVAGLVTWMYLQKRLTVKDF